MTRFNVFSPTLVLGLLTMIGAPLVATDPPHKIATANSYGSLNYCTTCHKLHGGALNGGALTTMSGNANLCQSCHVSGGTATNKPMPDSDMAVPAGLAGATAGGTSHRWDSGPQGRLTMGSPNSSTGTIKPSGAYTGAYASTLQIKISTAGATGVAKFDWSMTPAGSTTFGAATVGVATSTIATAVGATGVSLAFSSTGTFVLNDIFYVYVRGGLRAPVNVVMAGRTENGNMMCSSCHDQHLQANAPFDPLASQTYTAGTTNNRHFQRVRNDDNTMCGDCHASRNVGKGGTSHPVGVNRAAAPNTKAPSASLVLSAAGNVGCLTCHDIHGAPTATTPSGMLLRVSNSTALCTDCHTLADTTTANTHTNPTTGILWPGDLSGAATPSTYPAYTLAADKGACKNCHTPHGWPDAATPTQNYNGGFGARQGNLCMSCHKAAGQSNKNIQAEIIKTVRHPVARTAGNRLVGCGDCHNPHMAVVGVHTYATTADLDRNRLRATLGGVLNNTNSLRGVDGVKFTYSSLALWATPGIANFTKIATGNPATPDSGATYEYQVCFKCHTSYDPAASTPAAAVLRPVAWGGVTNYYSTGTATFTTGLTGVTGAGTTWTTAMVGMYIQRDINSPAYKISASVSGTSLTLATAYAETTAAASAYTITQDETDLAQEFNPGNRSGHPVVASLNNYTGSVAPRALINTYMKAPWSTNVGTQTMMCSDCHNTNGTAAQGPHGSANQFMLREFAGGAPAANWPNVTLNATFGATVASQSWCKNCHVLTNSITTTNTVHTRNSSHMGKFCYNCHVVVPHGSKMSRLIGCNTNMPARYAYQNNPSNMLIVQFNKAAPQAYTTSNCYATTHHSAITTPETW